MEGGRGHFEGHRYQQQQQTGNEQGGNSGLADRQVIDEEGPVLAGSIQKSDSQQHEARGERAHKEIFQGGFIALEITLIAAREDIEGNGNDLDPEEQHQQRVERGHQGHAAQHEKDEGKIFGQVIPHFFHIPRRQQKIDERTGEYDAVAQQPECFEEQHIMGVHIEPMIAHHIPVIRKEQQDQACDGDHPDGDLALGEDPAEHYYDSQ